MSEVKYTPSQQRVIDDVYGRMIVSASAGSGKTTVMIERMVGLIKNGADLDEIVALTFTDASARDMRAKLEKKLSDLAADNPALLRQLERVPFADVCTIDSLCKRIVTEYFEIAGIDPAFGLIDDGEKEAFSRRAFAEVVARRKDDEAFYALLKLFEKESKLKESFEKTAEFLSAIPDERQWLDGVVSAGQGDRLSVLLDRKLNRLKEDARDYLREADVWTDAVKAHPFVATRIDCLNTLLSETALPVCAQDYAYANYSEKQISALTGDYALVKEWGSAVKDFIAKEVCAFEIVPVNDEAKVITAEYVGALREYLDGLDEIKREENKLGFADVEKKALKVLRLPEVRERVLAKYSYVFVDEYQDINELQDEIIEQLTADNKFMVGDVKQSIYRFRHSEPEIFVRTVKDSPKDKVVVLAENFRSARGIIDEVNDVFDRIMDEGGGVRYSDERMINARSYRDVELAPVYYNLFEKTEEVPTAGRVYSVRDDFRRGASGPEASGVAAAIRALVDGYSIYDVDEGEVRAVRYDDIAVIVRSRSGFYYELGEKLNKAGIPTAIDRARQDAAEIKVLIDLLKLLDNEVQDVPLAGVMLGMFGFSEEELIPLAMGAKTFYEGARRSTTPKVVEFWRQIDTLRFFAGYKKVSELIEEADKMTGYVRSLDLPARENVVRMIRTIKGMALNDSVSKFLKDYTSAPQEVLGVPPAGENAVKVMTMHASKGLEFPIVFLCDLGTEFMRGTKGDYVLSKQFGIAFKNVDKLAKKKSKNTVLSLISEEEEVLDSYERVRLLYVAMTRAKNHLFMTGSVTPGRQKPKKAKKAQSFVQMLEYAEAGRKQPLPDLGQLAATCETAKKSLLTDDGLDVEALRRATQFRYPYESATKTGVKFAVTALSVDNAEQVGKALVLDDEIMRIGTLHHKVMEEISFEVSDEAGVKAAVEKMVELHMITRADADGVDCAAIARALNAEVIKVAKGAKSVRREYRFMLASTGAEIGVSDSADDVLVQGVIDLLILEEDGATIVDYKHSASSGLALAERYRLQLDLYSRAVESALGTKVKRRVILSLKTGEETEV